MDKIQKRPFTAALCFFLCALLLVALTAMFCMLKNMYSPKKDSDTADTKAEKPTVIIDAGHGGKDGGAVGADRSVIEKDINLTISKMLQKKLSDDGYNVIMTRTEDIMLSDPAITSSKKAGDLYARLKIMQNTENAVFVSIHMNAFSDSRYSGLQVYYSENDPRSRELAQAVQSKVKEALQPENERKIKAAKDSIYLLKKASCPAVLIECGFLSNPEECAHLKSEAYQNALAQSICLAIEDYICQNH